MLNRYAEIIYSDGMCHINRSNRYGIPGFIFLTKSSQVRLERIIEKYQFKKFSEYGYMDKYEWALPKLFSFQCPNCEQIIYSANPDLWNRCDEIDCDGAVMWKIDNALPS